MAGLVLCAAGLLAAPARAQQPVSLASLDISLWPEFDKPSVLVIMDGQVAASVTLPASLSIRIPAAAGAPNAVAVVGTDGGLFQSPYTTSQAGGDIIIAFTTSSAGFRVEYYDPSLVINGDARTFGLRWKSDFAIQAVAVRVQEPYGARGLTGQPALVSVGAGQYGLTEYTASLGSLPAGGTVSFDLGYAKTGSTLSATAVAVANASSVSSTQPAPAANNASGQPWLWGIALAGLVLAAGGGVWYWRFSPAARHQTGKRRAPTPSRHRSGPKARSPRSGGSLAMARARAKSAAAAEAAGKPAPAVTKVAEMATNKDEPARFCPQCGRRHQTGDRFCRQCGAPVRT